ncbi:hypothetical protein CPC16_009726 [Podila verticillata]|nr:hypothetical protein BGZ52_005137 [Haplosporangium bisporale]KAF9381696.1 hypothetical protein CPC16_009726 [Podila verticillata]
MTLHTHSTNIFNSNHGRRSKSVPRIVCFFAVLLQFHFTLTSLTLAARGPGPNRLPPDYTESDSDWLWDSWLQKQPSQPDAVDVDYCAQAAEISENGNGIVSYAIAKGCYEQFPFNPRIRDDTIDSVKANLESFYVFYDISRSPPPMENSDLYPVDLTASLASLRNNTYSNDYSFHANLTHMISQLQDPHTSYKNMCYQQFLFIQPLSTYGVYENDRQQVKVATVLNKLDPQLVNSLVDFISEYARTKSYSKDRGVRLNKAFTYLARDKTGSSFDSYSLGTFAQRTTIPVNPTIEYKIDCSAKLGPDFSNGTSDPSIITLNLAWSALDATMVPYTDGASYKQQFCSDNSIQTVKKFVLDTASPDDFSTGMAHLHGGRKKSRELYRGPYASFHLLGDGVTAVFRLGTESPNKLDAKHEGFYTNIDQGFANMEAVGAKKLIIDLQNNAGGIICWGRYVLQTLFPQTVDAPYIYNLRASRLAQALAQATFTYDQAINSPYEGLVDPETGYEVDDDSWMIPGVPLPGRDGAFSKKVTDRYCPVVEEIRGDESDAMFKPQDIVILTNGFCGSTCAVLALQLHERYGVRTMAIGGHHGQSMTFTSFPGGAVQANNTQWVHRVRTLFATLPASMRTKALKSSVPNQLPANGQLAFTFREVMSASHPEQVSEYMRIPSEFRMDYTSARFWMPSILWEDVRKEVWGDQDIAMVDNESDAQEDDEEYEVEDEIYDVGAASVLIEDDAVDLQLDGIATEADREDLEWLQQQE